MEAVSTLIFALPSSSVIPELQSQIDQAIVRLEFERPTCVIMNENVCITILHKSSSNFTLNRCPNF